MFVCVYDYGDRCFRPETTEPAKECMHAVPGAVFLHETTFQKLYRMFFDPLNASPDRDMGATQRICHFDLRDLVSESPINVASLERGQRLKSSRCDLRHPADKFCGQQLRFI